MAIRVKEIQEHKVVAKGKSYRFARVYIRMPDGARKAITTGWPAGVAKNEIVPALNAKIIEVTKRARDESKGVSKLDITIEELAREFIARKEMEGKKAKTIIEIKEKLTNYIIPSIGHLKVRDNELGTHIDKFIANLYSEKAHPTVHSVNKVLNGMLNYAVDAKRGITANPILKTTKNLITTKGKKHKIENPSTDEISSTDIARLMDTVMGWKSEIVFHLMSYCGLRVSEALAMTWENTDLDKEIFKVTHQIDKYADGLTTEDLTSLKTEGSERKVWIDDRTLDLLEKMIANTPVSERTGFLFKTKNNTWVSYDNFRNRMFNKAKTISGVPYLTPHKLRYYFASVCAENGYSLIKVSKWMGHTSTKMLIEIYAKLITESDDKPNISKIMGEGVANEK